MATIVALVEENRVDELTENFIASGWGENYNLIDRNFVSDERIYAAPIPYAADSGPLVTGLVYEPGAAVGVASTNEGVLHTNLEDELDEFGLTDQEKNFYAHRISEGGTFVAVEVDDDEMARVLEFFSEVDAQQMETAG